MFAHMPFQHLRHQTVDRAAHRRDLLQNSRTFAAALQRAFQRFGLPFNAAHPRQQLLLISVGMAHHFRLIVIYYTGV